MISRTYKECHQINRKKITQFFKLENDWNVHLSKEDI